MYKQANEDACVHMKNNYCEMASWIIGHLVDISCVNNGEELRCVMYYWSLVDHVFSALSLDNLKTE